MFAIAKDGYFDLWSDALGEPYSVVLEVDTSNNTVVLPNNFIKEEGVYYAGHNSELISLTRNENINKVVDDCGDLEKPNNGYPTDYGQGRFISNHINKNGQLTGGFYGAGGRSIYGDFTIRDGRIWLSSDFRKDEIYLRYLGSPIEDNGDIYVHPWATEPIKDWIYWKMIDKMDGYPRGEKEARFDRFLASKDWMMNRLWSMSAQETKDLSKKNFSLAPKL